VSLFSFLKVRLQQGTRSLAFPPGADALPERFRGRPLFDAGKCPDGCRACAGRMPSRMLRVAGDRPVAVDVGASLFSPDEADACPAGALRFTDDYRMASATRDGLIGPDGTVALAPALDRASRRVFGRALRLRSVSAGSCNGCEAELVALGNVVFDLARFGVQFVASPRHADGLVITGAVNVNMRDALRATWEATPEPRMVIAVGACAINGGPFEGSPEVTGGVPADIPVDLWVPGCPPHPLTTLDGILRLLGRIGN
jgi:Ni,Fe-hydrogenase III small subunit/formate hydrogenlyase subunit 6/NADH:ubiquinone oxidoreductase subunit I